MLSQRPPGDVQLCHDRATIRDVDRFERAAHLYRWTVSGRQSLFPGNRHPTCNAVLICDEYALTVSGLSAATTASKYIRIEVGWMELGEAQFDLYVFSGTSATGQLIASSIGNMTYVDPDVVLIPAINGTHSPRCPVQSPGPEHRGDSQPGSVPGRGTGHSRNSSELLKP